MEDFASCLHLDLTDEGVCKLCGTDITTEEFVESLPEVPGGTANLGDIMGIVKLARATAEGYLGTTPKFRWAGTQLIRSPDKMRWTEACNATFPIAQTLGYRGDNDRWVEVCRDIRDLMTGAKNAREN
jgi:hypothetical protein